MNDLPHMITAPERLTLADLFDPADLAAAIDGGHVTRKPHPTLPISIYTYTAPCQYGHVWTPVTMQCRGLIADSVWVLCGPLRAVCGPASMTKPRGRRGLSAARAMGSRPGAQVGTRRAW